MNALNLTIEDFNSPAPGKIVKVARFTGYLDSSNVEDSKKIIDEVITNNPANLFIIFDFEKLEYLNSMAIGCMVECIQNIEKGGGKLIIAHPADNVRDVLTVVGLDKVMQIHPTVEEAWKSVA